MEKSEDPAEGFKWLAYVSVSTYHLYLPLICIYIYIDQVLYRTQCENAIRETSLELTEKISQQKKSAKKDFHSAWSDVKKKENILLAGVKSKEVDLAYAKFAFEKENYQEELHQKEAGRKEAWNGVEGGH